MDSLIARGTHNGFVHYDETEESKQVTAGNWRTNTSFTERRIQDSVQQGYSINDWEFLNGR
jgi:hypothetical protein